MASPIKQKTMAYADPTAHQAPSTKVAMAYGRRLTLHKGEPVISKQPGDDHPSSQKTKSVELDEAVSSRKRPRYGESSPDELEESSPDELEESSPGKPEESSSDESDDEMKELERMKKTMERPTKRMKKTMERPTKRMKKPMKRIEKKKHKSFSDEESSSYESEDMKKKHKLSSDEVKTKKKHKLSSDEVKTKNNPPLFPESRREEVMEVIKSQIEKGSADWPAGYELPLRPSSLFLSAKTTTSHDSATDK